MEAGASARCTFPGGARPCPRRRRSRGGSDAWLTTPARVCSRTAGVSVDRSLEWTVGSSLRPDPAGYRAAPARPHIVLLAPRGCGGGARTPAVACTPSSPLPALPALLPKHRLLDTSLGAAGVIAQSGNILRAAVWRTEHRLGHLGPVPHHNQASGTPLRRVARRGGCAHNRDCTGHSIRGYDAIAGTSPMRANMIDTAKEIYAFFNIADFSLFVSFSMARASAYSAMLNL